MFYKIKKLVHKFLLWCKVKSNLTKVINFRAGNEKVSAIMQPPLPAAKCIPDWYKNLSLYVTDNGNPISPEGNTNLTAKACVPVLDALTTGYIVTLPCDIIFVDPKEYGHRVIWEVSWDVISSHSPAQMGNQAPDGYESRPLKWEGNWETITPEGYSILITHPFYRYDLPFITTTAIVDSDKFTRRLNLPFFIKEGFVGTIPKGTPIAQMIPIKRETWESTVLPYDPKSDHSLDDLKTTIFRSYKTRWWNKKTYR